MKYLNTQFLRLSINPILRQYSTQNAAPAASMSLKDKIVQLRKLTGATMAQCQNALKKSEGDVSKAVTWIEENLSAEAKAQAAKLVSRVAAHGSLITARGEKDGDNLVVALEVNSETDFVARSDTFKELLLKVQQSLVSNIGNFDSKESTNSIFEAPVENVLSFQTSEGTSISSELTAAIGKVKENLVIRRAIIGKSKSIIGLATHGSLVGNNQNFGGLASILFLNSSNNTIQPLADKVAKHVVGMNPSSINELMEQSYLFEPELSVKQLLERESSKTGSEIKVIDMRRIVCGETTTTKNEANFKDEVEKILKKN